MPSKNGVKNTTQKAPKAGMMTLTFDTTLGAFIKLWPSKPYQGLVGKDRFKIGDRVMMYSAQGIAVHGTVRWIGTITPYKMLENSTPVLFAGIETVSTVL